MARMNLDDQFWVDVLDLVAKVGDQDKAIGNAVRFFKLAQEKHKQGRLISEEDFKAKGFLEALIPIFAKRTPSGIQATGASKHFAWLDQKAEAGREGGKKSAKRPRDSKGRLLKKDANENASSNLHQANPNDHQASISISSINNNIRKKENSQNQNLTTPSATENFEAQFQTDELEQIAEIMNQAYGGGAYEYRLRLAPKILAYFKTPEDFGEWVEGVINGKNCPDPAEDKRGFDKYFSKSLHDTLQGVA